jgi:pimeloyl-ACP methyl ester carboxylesterase
MVNGHASTVPAHPCRSLERACTLLGELADFAKTSVIYTFGDLRIDSTRFQIARGQTALSVEPQVLELLIVLIENRDRVVTRDELLEKIWKGRVVSDATLSSRIKTARHVIGDDGTRQEYIKTIHGRGFRFVGKVGVDAPPQPDADDLRPESRAFLRPAAHYARSGAIHIAYHLFGNGPVNLVLCPGFVSHIDNYWDEPSFNRMLSRLGGKACVAMFDKRGTGMSDKVDSLPGMDERMDDVRAVMDAVGFTTAFIMGISEGGSLATLFAAHHPERCDGLILYGSFAQFKHWFPDEASLQTLFDYIESDWGSGRSLPQFAPTAAVDPEFVRWWGKFERLGATPGAAISLMRMNSQIDISDVLPTVRVPTLVIHRSEDVLIDVEAGRQLAEHIPKAQYVELAGPDHLPFAGENSDEIIAAIERFLRPPTQRRKSARVLATIPLIRIEADRPFAGIEESAVREEIRRFRATRISSQHEGIAATFDGPARALECARSVSSLLRSNAVDHRIGVHAGEISLERETLDGVAVNIAADVANRAGINEVLVSRTVNDLVAGSGVALQDCGMSSLPSIGQDWHLFRVVD